MDGGEGRWAGATAGRPFYPRSPLPTRDGGSSSRGGACGGGVGRRPPPQPLGKRWCAMGADLPISQRPHPPEWSLSLTRSVIGGLLLYSGGQSALLAPRPADWDQVVSAGPRLASTRSPPPPLPPPTGHTAVITHRGKARHLALLEIQQPWTRGHRLVESIHPPSLGAGRLPAHCRAQHRGWWCGGIPLPGGAVPDTDGMK